LSLPSAFLADIVANPDDDTPRLVYADWLEDNGDPQRARFIRVQCRLARLGQYDLERYDLEGEQADLLQTNQKKWRKPLARVTARVTFRRGFPDTIALPATKFAEQAEEALSAAPTVREYRVLQPAGSWDALMRCKPLARLRALDAGYHRLGVARVQALARCPHVANLRQLNLASSAMRPSGMAALAGCRFLAPLRKLDLSSSHVGESAVERVVSSPYLHGLTELDLSRNELTAAAIARLARWEAAQRLESLALAESALGDEAAHAFASGEWPALRRLTFDMGRMTEAGVEALGRCPSLSGLRVLRMQVWARHLPALAAAPSLANLESLSVQGAADEAALSALAGSPLLGGLRSLSLNAPNRAGLAAILASPSAAGLRELSLDALGRGPYAAEVAGAEHLVNLRRLVINHTPLGPREARLLANAPHLGGLVELILAADRVGEEAARELIASPHLKRLRKLSLLNSPVLLKGAITEALAERFGAGVVLVG
jgi:uncharacterized protein (TIGR02996 family)